MMRCVNNVINCVGCGACEQICPIKCIKMERDEKGFLCPRVDLERCINCGKCAETCIVLNNDTLEKKDIKRLYGVVYKNEDVVMRSSSGGAFYALAEYVLNNGGVVSGVIMEDNYHVRHIVIESLLDIDPLLCSKYVQSDIADTFNVLADAVKAGKKAMFCGTPCQCAAIRRFLNNKRIDKKLVLDCFIAVEFICHGVPSPGIWEDYIRGLCEEKHVKLLDVGFRRKTDVGWHQFTFTYREGIEIRSIPIRKDIYFNGFLENLFLRDCCYECNFKGIESSADISIADFWGSEKYAPELNEYNHIGISLMTIFSEKGIGIFEEIKNNLYYVEVADICAFTSNTASVERACRNRHTKAFYKTKTKRGTMVALRRYATNTLSKKVRNKIYRRIGSFCKRN